ncbi:MAG TPA: VWA domain-containing protein [Polyangia bacterium]|nr:VWA domain-containing protein [Polyangia bacterium]HWE29603.1 VWA domain-containing protein [Polyangia bacterium]
MNRALILSSLLVAGCGLKMSLVDASVRKPSNVAVYFSVVDHKDVGVPNLAADQFHVYEDGKLVSPFESKQTILNPEVAAVQYTLLLMDVSGSVTGSGAIGQLTEAASQFTDRVSKTQEVAVYAFAGEKEIHPIVGFTSGGGSVKGGIDALAHYKPRDPSTNLNGAVIEALGVLGKQMEKAPQPLKFGTLVVFTDGTDHAHRVSREDLMKALDDVKGQIGVFVIGVGAEIDPSELRAIGRAGSVTSRDPQAVKAAFDQIASAVEAYTKSFYLFSYCSPARAGEHDVRIEADVKGRGAGSLEYHFNAAGFQPNCDPNQKPSFDVKRPKFRKKEAARPVQVSRR